jgi:alpha-beta hydrolase superfamily lysophospholipase
MRRYDGERAWREIQEFLPADLRFDVGFGPSEESWPWRGHGVHLDRFENVGAAAKLILLHGVGTNGRMMSLIVGGPLWKRGLETVSIDLPGYGLTDVAAGRLVLYDDWVDVVSDLVDAEVRRDHRPVVLFGLSAGGMLTYHVAARNERVAGIAGTTFLDPRLRAVRDAASHDLFVSRVVTPIGNLAARTPLGRVRLPMRAVSRMYALVNHRGALDAFLRDDTSAGNSATIAFLSSYLRYAPAVEPEAFTRCPILLTQPQRDRWTPLALSELVLDRIHGVPKRVVMLENAGHYPLEQPGLGQLENAIVDFVEALVTGRGELPRTGGSTSAPAPRPR